MSYGTSTVFTNIATWSVASSGFVNPTYLGPADTTTGLTSSTGFNIEPGAEVVIAFEGTYAGQVLVHQQTADETGVNGWFNVQGFASDGSASGSGVSTSGLAYSFPAIGVRHRIQVTALASGTLLARASIDSYPSAIMGSVVAVVDNVMDAVTQTASATATGVLLTLSTAGYSSGSFQFTSLGAGNIITFEGTNDGTNWVAVNAFVATSGFAPSTTYATSNGAGFAHFEIGSLAQVRARVSTYGSGTITVTSVLKRNGNNPTPVIAANSSGLVIQGAAGGNALPTWNVAPNNTITAASGNVANTAAVATLAAVVGKTTHITGFQCTASGSTAAAVVSVTVAGVITGTMTYTFVFPAGVTALATPLLVTFPNPIPASATNTTIVVTLPAGGGGNTNATVAAQGYQI